MDFSCSWLDRKDEYNRPLQGSISLVSICHVSSVFSSQLFWPFASVDISSSTWSVQQRQKLLLKWSSHCENPTKARERVVKKKKNKKLRLTPHAAFAWPCKIGLHKRGWLSGPMAIKEACPGLGPTHPFFAWLREAQTCDTSPNLWNPNYLAHVSAEAQQNTKWKSIPCFVSLFLLLFDLMGCAFWFLKRNVVDKTIGRNRMPESNLWNGFTKPRTLPRCHDIEMVFHLFSRTFELKI